MGKLYFKRKPSNASFCAKDLEKENTQMFLRRRVYDSMALDWEKVMPLQKPSETLEAYIINLASSRGVKNKAAEW